ncbi:MAG TPA: nucleotidyltransferase family protein [Candidatus Limiplasma sp.]|nr:nucleotidyltransferase family protein [Candidatus Limiplasma sp.]HPR77592.1 nucleotidyltransferase family protein [Candidatus Limiplasma sp.]
MIRESEAGMEIGCVILASGESVRFGSNKLLADFCGKPLLTHLLDALPGGLTTVVVTRSVAVCELAKANGFRCLLHRQPEVRDTIRLGLAALPDTEGCLFCVGDQPLLTAETIQKVVDAYREDPTRIVRAAYGERQGNPALFPPSLYGELATLAEGEAGVTVIRRHPELVRTVQAAFAEELADADTPEALEALQKLIQPKE